MKQSIKKTCVECGKEFPKPYHCSLKDWQEKRKLCSRQCVKAYRKGKRFFEMTDEMRKKMSMAARRGSQSNFWKGGKTELTKRLRTFSKYRLWRESIFRKDNWTCVWCGARHGNGKAIVFNADHIKPFYLLIKENNVATVEQALDCKELWEVENGRTLCVSCHQNTETWGRPKLA